MHSCPACRCSLYQNGYVCVFFSCYLPPMSRPSFSFRRSPLFSVALLFLLLLFCCQVLFALFPVAPSYAVLLICVEGACGRLSCSNRWILSPRCSTPVCFYLIGRPYLI